MRAATHTARAIIITTSLLSAAAAEAADVRLIAAAPVSGVVREIGARFERETGHRLIASFTSGPIVKRNIDAGEAFDVAISITPVIDALVKENKIASASRRDVAYATIGVGVRRAAAVPEIGSVETFKRALLAAGSVAHSAEGASGAHFKSLIERLGIAREMAPKLRPMPADKIARAVPDGHAEMVVVTMSVIVGSEAVLVGPLPSELQFYNGFAAGISTHASEPEAAAALMAALTRPDAHAAIKAHGMEPGTAP